MDKAYLKTAAAAAVDYRERGWSPIPLKPRSKEPKLAKGHPFLGRPATEEEFARFDFRHNVGIVTGRVSGIIVLDDDDGGETMRANGWRVPATPTAKTKRGHQYFFRCPEGGFPTCDLAGKVEVRADGAYVVAAPSIHPSGERYEWVISPEEAELADPPAWLVKQARLRGRRMQAEDVGETISNGSRNKALFSIAGTLRRRGLNGASIAAALLGINEATCETPLDEDEVRRIAQSASRYEPAGPPPREEPPPQEAQEPPRETLPLAGRVLLARGIEEGVEPPEELEQDILLKGKIHSIYAASGTGKTWLMLWLMTRCIERGEKVIVLDAENGPRIVAERLASLGVDTSRLDELLLYFPYPNLDLVDGAASYEALLLKEKPDLVIFDSLVNFLGSAGLEENSNDDIVKWAVRFTRPARERGITVLLLDHVPHESGHARGASRKKDEVDVMWELQNPLGFDRDAVGRIVLQRKKDREGWLPERVGFYVGGTLDGFIFRRSEGTVEEPNSEDGLKDSERKALDTLRDSFGPTGATASEWRKATGQANSTFFRARDSLLVRELVLLRERRYSPAPGPGSGSDGSTESLIDMPDLEYSQELPNNSHGSNGSGAKSTPITPTALRGGSNGSSAGATPRGGSLSDAEEAEVDRLVGEGMGQDEAVAQVRRFGVEEEI